MEISGAEIFLQERCDAPFHRLQIKIPDIGKSLALIGYR